VTPDDDGTLLIEAVNRCGVAEQELWCTVGQARTLGALLVAL